MRGYIRVDLCITFVSDCGSHLQKIFITGFLGFWTSIACDSRLCISCIMYPIACDINWWLNVPYIEDIYVYSYIINTNLRRKVSYKLYHILLILIICHIYKLISSVYMWFMKTLSQYQMTYIIESFRLLGLLLFIRSYPY